MRTPRILLVLAGALALVAIAMLLRSGTEDFGWFAYAPGSDSISSSSAYLLSREQVVALALGWLASLIAVGVIGHQLAVRRLRRR